RTAAADSGQSPAMGGTVGGGVDGPAGAKGRDGPGPATGRCRRAGAKFPRRGGGPVGSTGRGTATDSHQSPAVGGAVGRRVHQPAGAKDIGRSGTANGRGGGASADFARRGGGLVGPTGGATAAGSNRYPAVGHTPGRGIDISPAG